MKKNEYLNKKHETDLNLLKISNDIIKQNDIQGYIYFGTLIGAIRHDGFIPWDDDVDFLVMLKDRQKLATAMKEFCKQNPNYFYQDGDGIDAALIEPSYFGYKNIIRYSKNYYNRLTPISVNSKLDFFYAFYLKPEQEKELKSLFKFYNYVSTAYRSKNKSFVNKTSFAIIRKTANILRKRFDKLEKELVKNTKEDGDLYYVESLSIDIKLIKLNDTTKVQSHKFENIDLDVPSNYEEILTSKYGDWRKFPTIEERENFHVVSDFCFNDNLIDPCSFAKEDADVEILFSNDQFITLLTKNQVYFDSNNEFKAYQYKNDGMKVIFDNNATNITINIKNSFESTTYFFNRKKITIKATPNSITINYK